MQPKNTDDRLILGTARAGSVRTIKQSTAATVLFFLRDATTGRGKSGFNSGINAQNIAIVASKNGAAGATITPTLTDLGSSLGAGWYSMALTSSHTDTLGELVFHITALNAVDNDEIKCRILAFDPEDPFLGFFPTGSVVADGSNSATAFHTSRSESTNDYWKRSFLKFTSGVLSGQVAQITGYTASGGVMSFASPGFTGTPAAGVTFTIINT